MKPKNVTLEMSLKPFFKDGMPNDEYIQNVCRKLLVQWHGLTKHAETISIMFWTADGSEILDYRGDMNAPIEWAKYIGGANPDVPVPNDPESRSAHSMYRYYTENPPEITYANLKNIITILRQVGHVQTDKQIRIGATFDPGPEFAKSPFKYERHEEIHKAGIMGQSHHKFAVCYAKLHGDDIAYAGFPNGIEEGTSLGTFLGRQSQHFLKDMGFDYLWLSNGFGYGKNTWATTGDIFDSKKFYPENIDVASEAIKQFWLDFREECDFDIETRGTNLSTGIDISSDATPYKWLNQAGLNVAAPPNSPWAAIDGDFGFELMGYMSHIAELPKDLPEYPFRFYTHDPWWLNSPWLDRYQRSPHDIYLPMSVSRINENGGVQNPSAIEFLTIDDSYGLMPDQVPNEVIPHILKGMDDAPDKPGALVWVYPFDELHRTVFEDKQPATAFFGDWLMRGAINNALPVNTIISTGNFRKALNKNASLLKESIVVTLLPEKGKFADKLIEYIDAGGRVLFYGPCSNADPRLLEMLGLELASPISGQLELELIENHDNDSLNWPGAILHDKLLCNGGYDAVVTNQDTQKVLANVTDGKQIRAAAIVKQTSNDSMIGWARGTVSASWSGIYLLNPYDPKEFYLAEKLLRFTACEMGLGISVVQSNLDQRSPVATIARNKGSLSISTYSPNTNVDMRFKFSCGAPLLTTLETFVVDGHTEYRFGRSWHGECRVFVQQDDGELWCDDIYPGEVGITARRRIKGLSNATVRFLPEPGYENSLTFRRPDKLFLDSEIIPHRMVETCFGPMAEVQGISGDVMISW